MKGLGKVTRRTFMIGAAAVAGGMAFGYWKYRTPYPNPLLSEAAPGQFVLNLYLRIDPQGVTIITPRAEMGQGVQGTMAALVAEELDLRWEDVRIEHGPASHAYFNAAVLEEGLPFRVTDEGWLASGARAASRVPAKLLGMQLTGSSTSTVDAYDKMRSAGAAARIVLIAAAARRLGVPADTLRTADGFVVGAGARLAYTELAPLAVDIAPPDDPPLKPRAQWRLLGSSLPRLDMLAKCTGQATYAIDVRLPGMLHAAVRRNPHLGAPMTGFDATKARAMPGVRQVVDLGDGVAVVATNTWHAFKAAEAVDITWARADYPAEQAAHFSAIRESMATGRDSRLRDDGDVAKVLTGDGVLEGEYQVPYLAHATMEPLNAVALLSDDRLEIWAGNQNPTQAAIEGARLTGLPVEAVRVHTMLMGGGFGRRAEMDFVIAAVKVAMALPGTPVKATWSREEDTRHDTYRPAALARFRAKVADGRPVALDLRLAAPSVVESQFGRMGLSLPGPDVTLVQSAWDQPYAIEHYRVTGYRAPPLLPVSSWRSVGASQNGFFHEGILDELAHAAGADPLQMRLDLLVHEPSRQVLQAVAGMSGWGTPLPPGHGRGVAFVLSFGVPCAQVIEVRDTPQGIRLLHAWAAVDVGIALDPRNIEAQVQGGMLFGLAAAMQGEITVAQGRVQQSNFHDYDTIRLNQAPTIEVKILENGPRLRGIGEPGTPPAAPALANAIFAATGRRIRELPLRKHVRFA